ncbi:DUF1616 domain-containing protein [Stygiolobus caldivivus]|uniref:DUF1616 domain-containing protein n=1 Tax=Stygiolobus caldivivus TaxID=2824673 RepID=A0A8D5U4P7_9CREN|nr:DUF1616 domain-containing protein [Stygiolobus caldivivus]BCU69053.1 hypothetical protein KN1_03500 [Stygiolobus caldivivus]
MEQNLQQLIQQYKEVYYAYEHQYQLIHDFFYLVFLIPPIFAMVVLIYRDKITNFYNNLWYSIHKRSKIMSVKKNSNTSMFLGIFLGLIILAGLFSFGYYVLQVQPKEQFPIMLLLNAQGSLGNYPTSLIPGENTSVIVLVKNYEGKPELFMIKVYLVNSSSNITIGTYYNIVQYKGEWEQLIPFSIKDQGQYKVQFFLYYYDISSSSFRYTGVFTQLLVNVSL